ncbi:SRPBCC family protein [Dinghuibacter silviterrae]|uniref:Uncharacterized protein YndB with AHSA1/START domain n=1 Tax=Dinghuibacter silviterrae TaxID=1539049 RepID=A0A4R8DXX5_9BACT|nr:SRPBCC domain-containing protein [Dinghuibacter silviterrae]TDX02061.1 uncharacterized protein YndB with AHSA1/START domain [Dinghuibacter silviterrae]
MISTLETKIAKDPTGKKLIVTRDFNAPLARVWHAWTDSQQLDKWWAPKPWKAETKTMDFKPGGHWLYAMVSPEGEKHWCMVAFQAIEPQKSFSVLNGFCDEQGQLNPAMPRMHWFTEFKAAGDSTAIRVEIGFDSEADLQRIVEMGFEQGFKMGLGNLDELLG